MAVLYSADFNTLTAGAELAAADPANWTRHSSSANDLIVSNAGRIRTSGASSASALYYLSSVTPTGYDLDFEADVMIVGTIANRTIGVVARLAVDTFSCYIVRYDTGTNAWQLLVVDNGSATTLATYPQALDLNWAYHVTLAVRGHNPTVLTVMIEDTEIMSGINNNTARTQITGRYGIRGTGAGSNTAGPHIDNLTLTSIDPPTPTGATARLWRPSKLKGLVG